jgi:hypothetical protein
MLQTVWLYVSVCQHLFQRCGYTCRAYRNEEVFYSWGRPADGVRCVDRCVDWNMLLMLTVPKHLVVMPWSCPLNLDERTDCIVSWPLWPPRTLNIQVVCYCWFVL